MVWIPLFPIAINLGLNNIPIVLASLYALKSLGIDRIPFAMCKAHKAIFGKVALLFNEARDQLSQRRNPVKPDRNIVLIKKRMTQNLDFPGEPNVIQPSIVHIHDVPRI